MKRKTKKPAPRMRNLLASRLLDPASRKELAALLACEVVLRQAVREKVGTRKHDPATFLLAAAALGALDRASAGGRGET